MKRLTLILLLLPFLADAQTTYNLDTVTVSATRLPMQISETGRSIQVLTSADIEALPVKSIDELIRYLPGVEVQSRGALGSQGDIIIRGSTFQQVLVLIDGMRLNDPLTGHFNSYIPVSLAEIARIEVLKGPASALYGADAVGGVVHIITKTFDTSKPQEGIQAKLGVGQHGLISADIGGFFQQEDTRFSGGIVSNISDGFPREGSTPADFSINTGSFSVSQKINDTWRAYGRLGIDYRDFDAQYYYTRSTADQSRETVSSIWTQAGIEQRSENFTSRTDFSYKRTKDEFVFNPNFVSTNLHTTEYFNFTWNGVRTISDNLTFGTGIQLDNRTIRSNDRGNHDDWHSGVYAMAIYRLNSLALNGSLRADYDQNYGWELTPQVNASYQLNRLILRGAGGRSIRAADFTERFISNNLPGPLSAGRNIGNPDLKAERAWSWEIGADYFLLPGMKLSATYFSRESRDLIDYILTTSDQIPNNDNLLIGETYFYATNIESVTTRGYGIELWGSSQFSQKSLFNYSLGFTGLETVSNAGAVSKYISNHANGLFTGRLGYTYSGFGLNLSTLYKEREPDVAEAINATLSPSYFVMNLALSYDITKSFGIYLQVNNLLDEKYSDILGAQMPGRWFIGGLQISL